MKKVAIIFGGSGYIGTNLLKVLIKRGNFDQYYILDIKPLVGFEDELNQGLVKYRSIDVRSKINLELDEALDLKNTWVFNFAAIHREPGHEFKEYFDTNIAGAENVNIFIKEKGIKNLFFTSSIAPYGKSMEQRDESSNLYPETAYGISKALAENIHKQWLFEENNRRLIIVRPAVIFGPKDPGNIFRMIKSLKKGTFVLPNGGNIVKAYGYVYGLIESILFTINQTDRLVVYNYAENPLLTLKELVNETKLEFSYKKPTLSLPIGFLAFLAGVFQITSKLTEKKFDIHPTRVRKAGFPTNIRPTYLIENGFEFKYEFKNALRHWREEQPNDFKL